MSDSPHLLLVVDDEPGQRYATCRALQRAGFRVLEASSGEETLSMVALKPDLVVLDVHLPDMNGFEICRRLRANPQTAHVPVVHLSATFVTAESRVQGLNGGADAYLVQPVDDAELVATIRALLRNRDRWEAYQRQFRPKVALSLDADRVASRTRQLVLESGGYFVLNATTCAEAQQLAKSRQPDILIIDGALTPELMQFIAEAREELPHVPVLLLTAADGSPTCPGVTRTLAKLEGPRALLDVVAELARLRAGASR